MYRIILQANNDCPYMYMAQSSLVTFTYILMWYLDNTHDQSKGSSVPQGSHVASPHWMIHVACVLLLLVTTVLTCCLDLSSSRVEDTTTKEGIIDVNNQHV